MRLLLIAALIVLAAPASARAEGSEQLNSKCQASCKSTLDRCAAAANRRMQTAIKETTAYNVGSAARESADVKFESAFLTAEGCWDRYYACTGKCRPPKKCIDQCQSAFKRCFAAAEAKMRDGLGKMRTPSLARRHGKTPMPRATPKPIIACRKIATARRNAPIPRPARGAGCRACAHPQVCRRRSGGAEAATSCATLSALHGPQRHSPRRPN